MVGKEKLQLPVVGPVAPGFPREVAAEEAPYLFGPRIPAVEKPTGGEVVRLLVDFKLLVRSEGLVFWAMLYLIKALKNALSRMVLPHRFPFQ
jgi:hypothetical protein